MALQPIMVRSCSECANAHLGRGGVKGNLSNTKHRESIAIAILAHTYCEQKGAA